MIHCWETHEVLTGLLPGFLTRKEAEGWDIFAVQYHPHRPAWIVVLRRPAA